MVTHPVMLVGWALWVTNAGASVLLEVSLAPSWKVIAINPSLFPNVPAILVGYLVATRDLRAGLLDVAEATPTGLEVRVRAQCLAALAPFAVILLGNALLLAALAARGEGGQLPGVWYVVQGPATVLVGCLLGTLVGVRSAAPVAPAVVIVAVVAANLVTQAYDGLRFVGVYLGWVDWGVYDGTVRVGQVAGSLVLHDAYLLALGGLTASCAIATVSVRRAPWVAAALLCLAAAVSAAVLQYPS